MLEVDRESGKSSRIERVAGPLVVKALGEWSLMLKRTPRAARQEGGRSSRGVSRGKR